jgi:hypothetical protein
MRGIIRCRCSTLCRRRHGCGGARAAAAHHQSALWELGHTAWFAEWFILREAASSHPADANGNCLLTKGDDWFDSANVPHRSRWTLDLPSTGGVKTYCHEVLDRVLDKLSREANTDEALYPYRLALAHEDMHGEAFLYTLQTLGLPAPLPRRRDLGALRRQKSASPAARCNWGARPAPALCSITSASRMPSMWRRFAWTVVW